MLSCRASIQGRARCYGSLMDAFMRCRGRCDGPLRVASFHTRCSRLDKTHTELLQQLSTLLARPEAAYCLSLKGKTMLKMFSALTLLALTSACASMVSGPDASPYAPATADKNKVREGVVTYNPNGLKEIVDMRRKDALKKMYEACGDSNHYKIESETLKQLEEGDSSLANLGANQVMELKFRCL